MAPARYGLRTVRDPALVPAFVRRIPAASSRSAGGARTGIASCSSSRKELAIFDADGTLWVADVADDFTQWMIGQGAIPGEQWPTYMRIYRDDPPTGCRFLLTFFRGMTLAQLAERVDTYWLVAAQRQWIWEVVESLYHLADKGYPIWVVSGTPTDFLLPLQRMLPVEEVVGMDFEVDGAGKITGRHAGISCAGEGKAEKVLSLVGEQAIRFCAGNGSLDGPMMELAEVAWSVYPNPDFERYSRQRGWPVLPRPPDFVEEEKFTLQD